MKLKLTVEPEVVMDVPIVLNAVSVSDEYDGDFQTRRFVTHTLNFQMKTNLFGGVGEGSTAKKLGVNLGDSIYAVVSVDEKNDGQRHTDIFYADSEEEALSLFEKQYDCAINGIGALYAKKIRTDVPEYLDEALDTIITPEDEREASDYTLDLWRKHLDKQRKNYIERDRGRIYAKGGGVGEYRIIPYKRIETAGSTDLIEPYYLPANCCS